MVRLNGSLLAAGMALGIVFASAIGLARADETATLAGWGGITQEAVLNKLLAGKEKLGINVRGELSGAWPGIKAHLMAGAPGWDLIEVGTSRCEQATQAGLLAPIDYTIIDRSKTLPAMAQPNYVGVFTFAYGVAYQKKKFGDNPPQTWADFFDTKKFPGSRSMPGDGTFNLEAALLADGVEPKDVYAVLKAPGGVDRALRKLEALKPDIAVWWRSTGQATQLMHDGEVDIALFPNGRAQALVKGGTDLGFSWKGAFVDVECFMMPKNVANAKAAQELINLALDPVNQANFAAAIGYGPINAKAYETGILKPEDVAWLPTAPQYAGMTVTMDPSWYASKEAEQAALRFSKFLQQ